MQISRIFHIFYIPEGKCAILRTFLKDYQYSENVVCVYIVSFRCMWWKQWIKIIYTWHHRILLLLFSFFFIFFVIIFTFLFLSWFRIRSRFPSLRYPYSCFCSTFSTLLCFCTFSLYALVCSLSTPTPKEKLTPPSPAGALMVGGGGGVGGA